MFSLYTSAVPQNLPVTMFSSVQPSLAATCGYGFGRADIQKGQLVSKSQGPSFIKKICETLLDYNKLSLSACFVSNPVLGDAVDQAVGD